MARLGEFIVEQPRAQARLALRVPAQKPDTSNTMRRSVTLPVIHGPSLYDSPPHTNAGVIHGPDYRR